MAAIFQIRRGTTNVSLTEGELYLHQSSGSLQFGSGSNNYNVLTLNAPVNGDVILTGNITASNAYFSGDVAISGNLFLGNNDGDNISVPGVFTTNLVPGSNGVLDLGTPGAKWKTLYANSVSASFSGSIDGIDVTLLSQSIDSQFDAISIISASLISTSSANTISVTNLNLFSGSQLTQNSTLATYTGSVETRFTEVGVVTASLILSASAVSASVWNLHEFSSSQLIKDTDLETYTSSLETRMSAISTETASLETRMVEIGVVSSSLILSASAVSASVWNLDQFSSSAKVQLSNLELNSASLNTSVSELNLYSQSLKTAIELTGSSITVLGNLVVKGTQTTVDSTTIQLGDNIIELNGSSAANGGLLVKDATNPNTVSGSLLWDSTNDYWKAGALGNESKVLLADGDDILSSSLQLTELNFTTASLNTSTASLNYFSESVTASLESIYQTTASLNLFSASVTSSLISIYQTTASLNIYTASVNDDLASIHQTTASLNHFSQSVTSSLESIYQTTASLNTFSQSVTSSLESIYQTTASLNEHTESVNSDLESIHQTTASLNVFSESVTSSLESIYQTTASLNYFSESVTASLESIYQTTASLNYFSESVTASLESIYQTTASLNLYTESISESVRNLNIFSSSYYSDSASFDYRITILDPGNTVDSLMAINQTTASLNLFTSSVSASIAALESSSGYINYVTNSIEQLTGIEVADFDNNVAVTFINGTLKFIFGTPALPSSIGASLSGFLIDRFNNVNDAYNINGTWSNQGYTLISASLYEGSTLLTQVGSGTSLSYSATTSGSHTYRLEYTASSPLDGSLYKTSTTTTGTISKSNPASPTLTPTPTVQLGASSNQIEQGATGSISFTSASADPSNGWDLVNTTTNVSTPYYVTGSATGSTSISVTATANYESPTGDNIPDLTTTSTATTTYTKIRSLRYGASDLTAFTAGELENLALWDTTLGGSVGTIIKGTTNPSGQSVTIAWSGDKYHYIVFDSSRSNLSNITTSGFGVLGQFSVTTVGQYKVYKTNTLQAGGAGSSITYTLT
jgi:ABC-type transporter Mla subunit MlaD